MRNPPPEDLLEVVGCELGKRPAQAPTMDDLGPHLLGVQRQSDSITVRFAAEALATLKAFVEAERQCCAGVGWTVSEGPDEVALRIEAGPAQLEAFAVMIRTEDIENAR
ncbi:MAG: hypothetical protein IH863_05290 [Chloroflexi bacterium]|nr:hypothetical protein [Chloroflexota bacterium]